MQKTAFACRSFSEGMATCRVRQLTEKGGFTTQTLLAMKLTLLLITVSFLQVSAKSVGQSVSLSGRNIPLKNVFVSIKRQTGYMVAYAREVLQESKPVSVDVQNMTLTSFLDLVFKDQPLKYTIDNKTILVSEKPLSAQDVIFQYRGLPADTARFIVAGSVTDSTGKPLAGATVLVRGKQQNLTTTDNNGKFVLRAALNDVVVVSYIGYEDKSWLVKNAGDAITFSLKPVVTRLDNVDVVYTGYQALPKERATGSFGVITGRELAKIPSTSLFERMQGMVSGVDVTTATVAGKTRNGSIRIRGFSTIPSSYSKVSSDPLLVIDGFPSQISISAGALDYLNPDDIDQVTILKDAAAASIWGMQAANGVIVIVTKKGARNSKPSISFNATYGTSASPRMDYYPQNNSAEYIDLEKEHIDKGIFTDPIPKSAPGSYYPENASQAQLAIFSFKRGEITAAQLDAKIVQLGSQDNRSQVSKYLLQPASTQQYVLSFSGGGPNSSFYTSAYYYQDEPVYKANMNRGYTLNAGNTASLLNGKLTISTSLNYSNKRDKLNMSSVTALSTVQGGLRPYDMLKDGNGQTIYYDPFLVSSTARTLEGRGYLPFSYSPIDELNYSNKIANDNSIMLNLGINTNITSWLNVNISGNVGRVFSEAETYDEPESYAARMIQNKATGLYPTYIAKGLPKGGKLALANSLGRSYNLRGTIGINKSWRDMHQVNMIVGSEIREVFSKSSGETRYGIDKSINAFGLPFAGISYKDIYGANQTMQPTGYGISQSTTRALSYYSNAAYTFMGKYTISGSARFDDFNLLGVERRKRALPLWSAGVKWNIIKESFMKSVPWIDNLGARMTIGFSGNAPQGYAPVTQINVLGADYYSGLPFANIGTPAIDNLTWEKTRVINLGLDYSLFKNRLYGSAELYYKLSTDIIWNLPINGTYGFTGTLFNAANLNGKGVDLSVSVVPVVTKSFKWTSTINLSYNTNIIKDTRFKKQVGSLGGDYPYDGYPIDYMFSYLWAGLDKTGQGLIYSQDRKTIYTINDYPFYDIRGYSGRTTSPWFGGFINAFSYKGFDLSAWFSFNFGGVFRKPAANGFGFSNNGFVGRSKEIATRWRKPGDEAVTNFPGMVYGVGTSFYSSINRFIESDYLVRSRSYIKCRQVSLSYNVPGSFLNKIGLKNLTVSAVARELGLVWAKNEEKLDPEYLYSTGSGFQLPPSVKYTFRIATNF